MTGAATILPPPSLDGTADFRMPYANELILLSFEGHHREFRVNYELDGKRPSYAPQSESAASEASNLSLLRWLRRKFR